MIQKKIIFTLVCVALTYSLESGYKVPINSLNTPAMELLNIDPVVQMNALHSDVVAPRDIKFDEMENYSTYVKPGKIKKPIRRDGGLFAYVHGYNADEAFVVDTVKNTRDYSLFGVFQASPHSALLKSLAEQAVLVAAVDTANKKR